jgi:hypothetical protein
MPANTINQPAFPALTLLLAMAASWFVEGRSSYAPPLDTEYAPTTTTTIIIEVSGLPISVGEEPPDVESAKGAEAKIAKQTVTV